jgi:EAL domain-containing protein (putative c-di-GMP-specific phosphodiesterase class I)
VGDDVFAVLLYDVTTSETATAAARRIRSALDGMVPVDGRELPATTWIGIEVSRSGYERPDEMLRHAQMAMERAKAEGVAGTALFDPRLREKAAQRFQLESDLRLALDREQLRVLYQVVVSLETGAIAGAEALIRWAHPLEGLLSPERFIGLAEDTGLIVPITRWVLREACLQLAEWQTDPGLWTGFYLSVNLSARDLQDLTLCDYVRDLLHETGIPSGALRVEVTEGMLMADVRTAAKVIEGLRQLRVPILLDDFGTGYSSLSYLRRFPLDVLKIDRAFIRDLVTSERDRNLVRTIVHLAADLGMRTIAEGIDAEAQIEVLRSLGCEFGQGYHFGMPVDADSISDRLAMTVQ